MLNFFHALYTVNILFFSIGHDEIKTLLVFHTTLKIFDSIWIFKRKTTTNFSYIVQYSLNIIHNKNRFQLNNYQSANWSWNIYMKFENGVDIDKLQKIENY